MRKRIVLFYFINFALLYFGKSQVNFQWALGLGGTYDDVGKSIVSDGAGNVYTTGTFSGTVDFDPGPGVFNLTASINSTFISKLDASGNLIWAKQLGQTGGAAGTSIAIDASNNTYISGGFYNTSDFDPGPGVYTLSAVGSADAFICKLDGSGNFLWAKSIGGPSLDLSWAIAFSGSSDVIITGGFQNTADFDPGPGVFNLTAIGTEDIFVCKLNSSGSFIWAKNFGGSGVAGEAYSVASDAFGNIYTTGVFSGTTDFDPGVGTTNLTSAGGLDIFISKLDISGNFVWAKAMGGASSNADVGFGIIIDAVGNVYTTGYFNSTSDFDPGPGVYNLTASTNENAFISKLDASGSFVFAKQIGGPNVTRSNSIDLDASNNIYITGNFDGPTDFDPGVGVFNLSSSGIDVFVAKLDLSGNFIWAESMGGNSTDVGQSVHVDGAGNIYITGYYQSLGGDFDPGVGTSLLSSNGMSDIFIVKLSNSLSVKENNKISSLVEVFPNPSNGIFKINSTIENLEIKITTILGDKIKEGKTRFEKTEIDLSSSNDGIYFLNLFDGDKLIATKKIVKQ